MESATADMLSIRWLLLGVMVLGGCRSFDPAEVLYSCRGPGDCVDGWMCDEAAGICVPERGQVSSDVGPDVAPDPPSGCDPIELLAPAAQRCTVADVPAACGGELSGLLRLVLDGAMRTVRAATLDGAPTNQVRRSELCLGPPYAEQTWVPAQMAQQLFVLVLGHRLRSTDPTFGAGPDDDALGCRLDAAFALLERILGDAALHGDGPALYNAYTRTGEVGHSDFARTTSLIDQAYMVLALRATAAYLDGLGTFDALAERAHTLAAPLRLAPWISVQNGCASITLGGVDNPAAGATLDRIVTEARVVLWLAVALGDLDTDAARCLAGRMMATSIGLPRYGELVEFVPYFGTSLELVTATLPAAATELTSGFGARTLDRSLRSMEKARQESDGVAFGLTGASLVPGAFFDVVGPVSECAEPPRVCGPPVAPPVVVLPAAGALAVLDNPLAAENLQRSTCAAASSDLLSAAFGLPNGLDLGQGLVYADDPVSGYLEVATMATALLIRELGSDALEQLLRADPAFASALDAWGVWLNATATEGEATKHDDAPEATDRGCASGRLTRQAGLDEDILLGAPAPSELWLRYSYDAGAGGPDGVLEVTSAGEIVDVMLPNTRGPDCSGVVDGWNRFGVVGPLPVGAGPITLRLMSSPSGLFELDRTVLVPLQ